MPETEDYVIMPQNDMQQIEQIAREYETEPAKCLAHGVQKDAIQNAVGARRPGQREPNSYCDWKITFELLEINGQYALAFLDEGTTGLTGEILSAEQIEQWSAEGRLTPEQNLGRFLTRFEGGGGVGPGSFGRGKLIFQAASKTAHILCDSLRYEDGKYIAFERKIIGTRLKQTRVPHQDEEAKQFIARATNSVPRSLTAPGTRIIILNLKDEIADAVKKSFDKRENNGYLESFAGMIEETWWEILHKFDAKIFIKWGDKTKRVALTEPLRSIASAEDGESGWRTYSAKALPVVVGSDIYKIKELRFAVSPEPLNEDLCDIWIQRKRMKIGSIARGIHPHHAIQKKLCCYVVLDSGLEELVEKCEGTTHYGFPRERRGLSQIKQIVRTHLEEFQRRLGLRVTSETARVRQDMLDALKDISEKAEELGLLSEFFIGPESKDVEITVQQFELPNPGSKRVEFGQLIGPITYVLKNCRQSAKSVKLLVTAEQRKSRQKQLHQEKIDLEAGERKPATISQFQFSHEDFIHGESVLIVGRVFDIRSNVLLSQVSRAVWLGIEEPPHIEPPLTVTAYSPVFPRPRSSRVELGESIVSIRFKISNHSAVNVKVNADLLVRKAKTEVADAQALKSLATERGLLLSAMSEKESAVDFLTISEDVFGSIANGPPAHEERKCEIFFNAKAAENIPQLGIPRNKSFGKRKIDFYVGIDPPGHSIFKNVQESTDPKEVRLSWHEGDRASGYTFVLNVEHPTYKFVKDWGEEVKRHYIREQMLRQAYAIAVREGVFRGAAENFSDDLTRDNIPPSDAFLAMEALVGKALAETE